MANTYFPFNEYGDPMKTTPMEEFDPSKPNEYMPWRGEMRPLTNTETFYQALQSPKKSIQEGMIGDTARIVGDWLSGKEDEGHNVENKKRIREQTPEQVEIAYLLDQIETQTMQRESLELSPEELTKVDEEMAEGMRHMSNEELDGLWDEAIEAYEKAGSKRNPIEPEITWGETLQYAKDNWGEVGAQFLNGVVGEPELLMVGGGWVTGAKTGVMAAKTASVGVKATKAAELAGGVAGSVAGGAGLFGAMSAAEQYAEKGEIDYTEMTDDMVLGTYFGLGFGVLTGTVKLGQIAKNVGKDANKFYRELDRELANIGHKQVDDLASLVKQQQGKGAIVNPDETISEASTRITKELGLESEATKVVERIISREAVSAIKAEGKAAPSSVIMNERIATEVSSAIKNSGTELEIDLSRIIATAKSDKDVMRIVRESVNNARTAREIRILTKGAPPELMAMVDKELTELLRGRAPIMQGGKKAFTPVSKPSAEGAEQVLSPREYTREIIKGGFFKEGDTLENIVKTAFKGTTDEQYIPRIIRALKKEADITEAIAKGQVRADYTKALSSVALREKVTRELGFQEMEGAVTPMTQAFGRSLGSQEGFISTKLMGILAAAGIGSMFGETGTEKIGGAVIAVGGLALGAKGVKILRGGAREAKKLATERIKWSDMMNRAEGKVAQANRAVFQTTRKIVEVTNRESREKITLFLDDPSIKTVTKAMKEMGNLSLKVGASLTLTEKERKIADEIRKSFDDLYKAGELGGVLQAGTRRKDYVPHFWQSLDMPEDDLMSMAKGIGRVKTGTKTARAEKRAFGTFSEGMDAGQKMWSADIAEIHARYANDIMRTIENKKLVEGLGTIKFADGSKAVMKADKAPMNYVGLNHPQLTGMRVHPEMVDSMKFFFDATDPSTVQKGLLAVNFTAKRLLVSTSLFHANALLESMMFAGMTSRKQWVKMLDMLKTGGAGDLVDTALKSGLKIGTIEDVGTDMFYTGLREFKTVADRHAPVVGSAVKGFENFNHKVDSIMWDRIATGGKLAVFAKNYEKALMNPKYANMTKEEIAQSVSTFTNDAFGGLNWRRIAEGVENKFGRTLTMAAFHPQGRRYMQLLMFAPDWTLSNARVLLKAIPGVAKNKLETRLHQAYAARSAAMFMTFGTAVNSMYAGEFKGLWENKDPTKIDMGNGQTMSIFKQTSEVMHYGTKPMQTVLGKGGIIPKQILSQLMSTEYMSAGYAPKMYKEDASLLEKTGARARVLTKGFAPIVAQSYARAEGDTVDKLKEAASGFLGHPITGKRK